MNMKKSHIIAFVMASVMFVSGASVFAEGITVERDIENKSFTLSGTTEPNSPVRFFVVAPDKQYSDVLTAQNPFDIIKHQAEGEAEEDGSYDFKISFSGQSGVYTAYISADGSVESIPMEFVNPDNYAPVIAGLNNATDIEEYISQKRSELGFGFPLYDSVNKADVCNVVNKEIPMSETAIERNIDIFNTSVLCTAMKNGDIDGIRNFADRIGMISTETKEAQWYKKVSATAVDQRLPKNIDAVSVFESALREAIVLCVVENPNGYLNAKQAILDFASHIGIAAPVSDDRVYQDLAGRNFASYSALKLEYDRLVSKYSQGNTPSAGGGGGGGAGDPGNDENLSIDLKPIQPLPSGITTPIAKKHFNDMDNAVWAKEACEYLAEKGVISGRGEGIFAPMDNVTREEFVAIIVRGFGIKKYVDNANFTDLSVDDWCYDYIMAASQNGIIHGVGEGSFGKGRNITRQDMAAMLYRVISAKEITLQETKKDVSFKDAGEIPEYAKEAVSYLASRGIVNGMDDGSFCGSHNASRAQAAQMIYNVLKTLEE